jgi:hypothetical protein
MLDQIKIASPCSADWEQMEGNDRVRFCGECKKNVFNLSAMTRRDADALLRETNGSLCTRLYRRADGTVLTGDCPEALRVKIARVRRRIGWAVSTALGFATAWGQEKPPALSGVVDDSKLAPAANVEVTAFNVGSQKRVTVMTDKEGKFDFGTLEEGTYSVIAKLGQVYGAYMSNVAVDRSEHRVHLVLERVDQGSVGQD